MAEFPISGSIDPKAFPFLVMDLHRQGATGSLKVDGPSYQKALYFRGGRILFGSSNDPRDQLGSILIEDGKITPEQLAEVNGKVGPGNPLAKVLSETGFVSQRELADAARAKVERILSDVIAYGAGSFEFEDGVLPKGAVDLKLATERLVMTAVRRVGDRAFVLRHLDGLDVVLAPAPDIKDRLAEVLAETSGLAAQLDGRRTLKEAAAQARLDEFEAAKIACGMMFLGLAQRETVSPEVPAFFPPEDEVGAGELDLGATAAAAMGSPAATLISATPGGAEPHAEPPFPPPGTPEPTGFDFTESNPIPAFDVAPPPPTTSSRPSTSSRPVAATTRRETMPAFETEPAPALPTFETEMPTLIQPPAPPPTAVPPRPVTPSAPAAPPPPPPSPSVQDALVPPPPREARSAAKIDVPPIAASPRAARPSKEDLAALDALLNPRTLEGPLTPLEKPAHVERWAPQFGQKPAVRKGRQGGGGGGKGVILGGGIVLVVLLGAAGWWYAHRPGTRVAAATPAPPVTTPPPSSTIAPVPTAPVSMATIPPTLAPASMAPRPTPAAPRPPSPTSVGDPHRLLRDGSYAQAARAFASNVRAAPRGSASIQLLIACSTDTIQKAVQSGADDDLLVVPVSYHGRDCYRLLWGLYPSSDRASFALRTLPDYFRKGGASPKVIAASEIVP